MIANGQQYSDQSGTWTWDDSTQRWTNPSTQLITGDKNTSFTANGSSLMLSDTWPSGNNANTPNQIFLSPNNFSIGNSSQNTSISGSSITVSNVVANALSANSSSSNSISVGANLSINTSGINVGNSSVNTSVNSSSFSVGGVAVPTTRLLSKVKSFTKNIQDASVSTGYTGVGFQPSAIVFIGITAGGSPPFSISVADSLRSIGTISLFTTSQMTQTTTLFISDNSVSGANGQAGTISSYDADGFTISWTKLGTPAAATATFYALCFR